MPTTRAVVSSSAWRDYSALLPLVCLFWRERIGYEPLVLLVEDEAFWSSPKPCASGKLALTALRHFEFDTRFIGHVGDYEHATIAQSARQHCAVLDLPGDDWLLLSDADLISLDKSYYHQHGGKAIACYNANLDCGQSFPTCHQTMQVKTWRDVMGLNPDLSLASNLSIHFSQWLPKDNFLKWCHDQHWASKRIKASRFWPDQVQLIDRPEWLAKRIDRGEWPAHPDISGKIDCHVLKGPDENWAKIRPIIEQALPHHVAWADKFMKDFRAGY